MQSYTDRNRCARRQRGFRTWCLRARCSNWRSVQSLAQLILEVVSLRDACKCRPVVRTHYQNRLAPRP